MADMPGICDYNEYGYFMNTHSRSA